MNSQNFLNLAKTRVKSMVLAGLLVAALSFLFLVTTQYNFRAGSDLLVVQNQTGFTDYYTLSKSADYLTSVMLESAYSEKFITEVKNTNLVSTAFLPANKLDALKKWESMVKISRNPNLGIVHVEVFGADQKQVAEISNAVIQVMTTKNGLFLGDGQKIEVRVLSGPIWEKNPTVLNIAVTMVSGFLLGIALSLVWIYFSAEASPEKTLDEYQESLKYLEK
jgi:capsular polysaccharide biosynthesis protein